MQNKILLLVITILFSIKLYAQTGQTIRGTVVDQVSKRPIIGASITILNTSFGANTDEAGNFKITNIAAGRYQLKVTAINFTETIIPQIMVDLGKEKVIDIVLSEKVNTLSEVIVHQISSSTINPTSSRTFTVEESQRFAASFYDPARLVASFPGVTTTNDQGNNISIRGNSPNALAWRLEGVEIVNPNHLTNAGTYTDRPMQNGGGTIVLSAQMLGNSQFLSGAFSPEYGGSVGGMFDMRLRKGNNEKREYTIQAGLLGIDLSAEGPFSKKSKASYLLNYRYSFTGLLGAMGIPLGDEAIAYQDLSLNINLPTKKAGNFTLFGMYGASTNDFEIKADSLKFFAKDYSIINFESKMIAFGATHEVSLGDNTSLRTVIALSEKQNNRSELEYSKRVSSYSGRNIDNLTNQRISFNSNLNYRISQKNKIKLGLFFTRINDASIHGDILKSTPPYKAELASNLIQPYINFQSILSPKLAINAGLHYQYLTANKTKSIEPRASISYKVDPKTDLNFAYSLQGQMQLVAAYGEVSRPGFTALNRNLEFSKAHHYTLNFNRIIADGVRLKVEAFLQNHFDVLTTITKSPLSGMNLTDEYQLEAALNNEGTATNKGIELSLEKYFQKKYYFLISSTIYEAKYKGSDGIEINSKFNGKYAANFTAGKEWDWNRKAKKRVFGMNLRGIYQGGYSESPIDEQASRFYQKSISTNTADKIFTVKLPDYYRIDLRLSVKKQKPKYTRTLSLDIQNLTNHLNTAYFYFDWAKDKVVEKKQLGLIPVLNWRAEF
jgi:CarboxypepD_reg-like domain/TonB-dependent Receptor Plug Domain